MRKKKQRNQHQPIGLKATLLNSADKSVVDKSDGAWQPFSSSTIDGVLTVAALSTII